MTTKLSSLDGIPNPQLFHKFQEVNCSLTLGSDAFVLNRITTTVYFQYYFELWLKRMKGRYDSYELVKSGTGAELMTYFKGYRRGFLFFEFIA